MERIERNAMKYLLALLLILPGIVLAEIYKWTDESGKVHYSDQPHPEGEAETVSVENQNIFKAVEPPPRPANSSEYKLFPPVKVVMYATSWCPHCKRARNYFKKNRIPFTEYDIEKNRSAKRAYKAFKGEGVPLIVVDQQHMRGFDAKLFRQLYVSSQKS